VFLSDVVLKAVVSNIIILDLNKPGAFTLFSHRLKISCLADSEFWQASRLHRSKKKVLQLATP